MLQNEGVYFFIERDTVLPMINDLIEDIECEEPYVEIVDRMIDNGLFELLTDIRDHLI